MTTRRERWAAAAAQAAREDAERRRPQPVNGKTPWKWNESNPLYNDHIRNKNRKPPVPQIKTPQGDIAQEMQNWDTLDTAIDSAATDANDLLNILRDVLDRENSIKTADIENTRNAAQALPALGRRMEGTR